MLNAHLRLWIAAGLQVRSPLCTGTSHFMALPFQCSLPGGLSSCCPIGPLLLEGFPLTSRNAPWCLLSTDTKIEKIKRRLRRPLLKDDMQICEEFHIGGKKNLPRTPWALQVCRDPAWLEPSPALGRFPHSWLLQNYIQFTREERSTGGTCWDPVGRGRGRGGLEDGTPLRIGLSGPARRRAHAGSARGVLTGAASGRQPL